MSTITENSNAAAVRRCYEAVNEKDMETLTALFSPDVTLEIPGRSPLAGLYTGRDAVFGFFGQMGAISGGTYHAELRDLYAGETSVVAVHHGSGTRGDRILDADAAVDFELADGVVTGLTVHQQRQDGWDDFFA